METIELKSVPLDPGVHQVIVFKDGAENYYAVPRATLERSRVEKHRVEEVKEALENPTQCQSYERTDHCQCLPEVARFPLCLPILGHVSD